MTEHNTSVAQDAFGVAVIRVPDAGEDAKMVGHFVVECIGKDGEIKWTEEFDNQVATVGKDGALVDRAFVGDLVGVDREGLIQEQRARDVVRAAGGGAGEGVEAILAEAAQRHGAEHIAVGGR